VSVHHDPPRAEPWGHADKDARIREMFPTGSKEDDPIDYLDAKGFVPEWRRLNGQNAGRFVHNGLLCRKIVRVLWRADDRGRLTKRRLCGPLPVRSNATLGVRPRAGARSNAAVTPSISVPD
jgi:hypothetical protein